MKKLLAPKWYLLAALVFAFFVLAHYASAFTYTRVLKEGMTGQDVADLQVLLGGYPVTGYFDPNTTIAVKNFQYAHGLVADGVVGPKTARVLSPSSIPSTPAANPAPSPTPAPVPKPSCNPALDVSCGGSSSGSTSAGFQDGCKSKSGYSITTGLSCKLPVGCTSDTGYSSKTGEKCDGTQSSTVSNQPLPQGCTSRNGYSATTGVSCATGSAADVLKGTYGEIADVDRNWGSQGEHIQRNAKKAYIVGYDIKADEGSDLLITSLKLQIKFFNGSASKSLGRYVDTFHIIQNGRDLAALAPGDFSHDGDEYEETIPLYGAVVRDGQHLYMYVTADTLENISDSNKDNSWTVTLEEINYIDARGSRLRTTSKGAVGTDSSLNFIFNTK